MIDLLCLLEFYNTYQHDDIYHEVSGKMLKDFHKIGHMGMQELSDYLFISTSTLYRFIKMMDYENHSQMKSAQQMFLEQYMTSGRYMPEMVGSNNNLVKYGEYLCSRIQKVTSEVDGKQLDQVVEQMLEAEQIIFIGMPMPSIIWRLQMELVLLGKKTSAFLNPGYQTDAVVKAGKNTLIFMVQYMPENGAFYLELAKKAKKKKMKSIAISSIPISPTLEFVDQPISFAGNGNESDMIMLEMILHMLGNQLNEKVIESKRW
ncbi:hypothetical protein lbkm_2207 [Lachnospiraceae bacterium KM106-2]|nr:hypothetical protein lbkm_2207 [Lachnospiraceae bacterium KM106-2]